MQDITIVRMNLTGVRQYRYDLTCFKHSPNYYRVEYREPNSDTWIVFGRYETVEECIKAIKAHKFS